MTVYIYIFSHFTNYKLPFEPIVPGADQDSLSADALRAGLNGAKITPAFQVLTAFYLNSSDAHQVKK